MVSKLLVAWGLVGFCVVIHAAGIASAMRRAERRGAAPHEFWAWTWMFVKLAGWIILLHMTEITVWALFFLWQGAVPGLQASLYFSAVTYTTTGYGDILLSRE